MIVEIDHGNGHITKGEDFECCHTSKTGDAESIKISVKGNWYIYAIKNIKEVRIRAAASN